MTSAAFDRRPGQSSSSRSTRSGRGRTHSDSSEWPSENSSRTPPSSFQRGLRYLETAKYPHELQFKSPEITITINSPSVRFISAEGQDGMSLPVFDDYDHVMGTVALDPQNTAAESGKLTITLEGVFEYISPMMATKPLPTQITPGKHRHIFYEDAATIPLQAGSDPGPPRTTFKSALANLRRVTSTERLPTLRKWHSMDVRAEAESRPPSPPSHPKTFNFDFALPRPESSGDALPPSFTSSNIVSAGVRGRAYAENAVVKYSVVAVWEALDGSGTQAKLEAPILFHPDQEFQSLDGLQINPSNWSEIPLSEVKELPAVCAATLPSPLAIPRASSIPYYVVFTTTPRSRVLAAEIMADATVAVSLVRTVSFSKPRPKIIIPRPMTPSPPLRSRSSSLGFSDSAHSSDSPPSSASPLTPGSHTGTGARLFKRVVRSAPAVISAFRLSRADPDSPSSSDPSGMNATVWNIASSDKPLPAVPSVQEEFVAINKALIGSTMPEIDPYRLTDSRTLHTDVSVGFPKRAKTRAVSPGSHPSLASFNALPDGLYKGRIPLQRSWFPSLQWKGLQIQYALHVSVIFDSHEFKAKIPVHVY